MFKNTAAVLAAMTVVSFAHAGEVGMDQKLEQVYDLYRKGDTVSLKPSEMQVGMGFSYQTSNKNTLGLEESESVLATQVFASRGFGEGIEASVAVPYLMRSARTGTIAAVLQDQSASGIGNPTFRIIKTLPTQNLSTSAVLVISPNWGSSKVSADDTHTSFGVSASKTLRPAFVSGGLSWEHDWRAGVNGIGYNAGIGFFLNHALSLGGQVSGVIVMNPKMGTARDTTALGIKAAYQATPDFGLVTSVDFGIGSDTSPATVGVTAYWRY